jgi:hypothetical protein
MLKKVVNFVLRSTLPGDKFARRLGVRVGDGCRILAKHFGSEPFLIDIGDNVTVSHGVTFVNHDGSGWLIRDEKGRRFVYRRISIGSNCFIGANSVILPGVRIEDNVIVGAGSIVTRSIPKGLVVGGNPARVITTFEEFRTKALEWTADSEINRALDYKEIVMSVLQQEFKAPLTKHAVTLP